MHYPFNPHNHVKIWLSNKRDVFMNFENQTRLIATREKNPTDVINLVYDSSLLNEQAIADLSLFCKENNIIPVDAHDFTSGLREGDEQDLYRFYKDEITNLQQGGNLAVASDILRWLSPCYKLGTYTDLDVAFDTTKLATTIAVESPLLVNIGSLRLGNKEMVIAQNDCIAVVNEFAAKEHLAKVHAGLKAKLGAYSTDYIAKTKEGFGQEHFLIRKSVGFMENRLESVYIEKSNSIHNDVHSSRELRAYVNAVMSNQHTYLDFKKKNTDESHPEVKARLRREFTNQLGWIKWLFFAPEYNEIKAILAKNDTDFIAWLMKKERSLYIKSIVICTTGPIEVGHSLFGDYVLSIEDVARHAQPMAFNHYGLEEAFQLKNGIPLHETPLNMLRFLGADTGELNDSSWLEEGMERQKSREEILKERQETIKSKLPLALIASKSAIERHIATLERNSKGFWGFFNRSAKQEKILALTEILNCFSERTQTFNLNDFKQNIARIHTQPRKNIVYGGWFYSNTKKLIEELRKLCHDAVIYRVVTEAKDNIDMQNPPKPANAPHHLQSDHKQDESEAKTWHQPAPPNQFTRRFSFFESTTAAPTETLHQGQQLSVNLTR